MLRNRGPSHPEEAVKIGGFVAMGLNLDATTKDLNELLPFQLFWEVTKALPLSSQGFFAVNILSFLNLSCLVIPVVLNERERV